MVLQQITVYNIVYIMRYCIVFLISLLSTWWVFKKVLKIAMIKNIVDNPDARKLHRQPVPVLGGIAVFFGILVALIASKLFCNPHWLFTVMGLMAVMLYIGTMDDILSLSPGFRFVLEILVVVAMIICNDGLINNFRGIWDIWWIPTWAAVIVTIIACVGIINAINLIDGVNGLCSGYCITACVLFAIVFSISGNMDAAILAIISIGALIPFFFHNVFGKASKMFMGDGGSLLMGIIMSSFVVAILKDSNAYFYYNYPEFGLIPFALAVLSIPVFDTLRVMIMRIIRGNSPFMPDKTHLHHLFLDFGFSHIGTTAFVIFFNLLVVLSWWITYSKGGSIELQFYVVASASFAVTFIFYPMMRSIERRKGKLYTLITRIGNWTHFGHTNLFQSITKVLDRNCYEAESES